MNLQPFQRDDQLIEFYQAAPKRMGPGFRRGFPPKRKRQGLRVHLLMRMLDYNREIRY
jgi:hypothetical protein